MYIQEYGGSKGLAGLAWPLSLLPRLLSGRLPWALDRYGRRVILITGLLTFLIPSLVYTMMLPIIPMLFFRFVQGFDMEFSKGFHTWSVTLMVR